MKAALLAVAALAAAPAGAAPPGSGSTIEKVVAGVSAEHIKATIRKLASFGTRNSLSDVESDTRGIGAARRWIKGELERCSAASGGRLQVAFDDHLVESGQRVPKPTHIVNVVATLPGVQPESRDRIYVVSGHYDSMPTDPTDPSSDAPGANDDASGTAVSMELACVMSRFQFDATLVFLAVAGEEQGLLGSEGWAKAAKAKGLDVAGMLDDDIVGGSQSRDGRFERDRLRLFAEGIAPKKELSDEALMAIRTGGENDLPTRQLARFVKEVGERYVSGMKVDVHWRRDRYLRGGDHFSFLEQGYPAVRFTEPNENWNHQHQNVRMENGIQYGDLPEFVDFPFVAQVARVNGAALAALALAPSTPKGVEMEVRPYEVETTLRWKANPEPDLAGYRIVWRATAAADWQRARDVGNVTHATLADVLKDDYQFGVEACDREGHCSVAAYPRPVVIRK
ncbi:MAG TPA: M28 family metallopeptidase [Usitatibacter sp.]|nr:M28 family metallopeptidase [Usitatibacter sp.]